MDTLGPVSAALAATLQDLTRQHGFVLWPDRPAAFVDLVDRLVRRRAAGELPFDVVAFNDRCRLYPPFTLAQEVSGKAMCLRSLLILADSLALCVIPSKHAPICPSPRYRGPASRLDTASG